MSATIDLHIWHAQNQRVLLAAIDDVRHCLERHVSAGAGLATGSNGRADGAFSGLMDEPAGMWPLDTLCAAFELSTFERALLLLCAAMELDAGFGQLCAQACGDPARPYPTFSLALAALPDPEWYAITPEAPLRRWRLIEMAGASGYTLTQAPLRIDERVLHYLTGVQHLDERLVGLLEPVAADGQLPESHRALAGRIAALWSQADNTGRLPAVQLCGLDPAAKRGIAAAACAAHGLHLCVLPADLVPSGAAELDTLLRLWEREAVLGAGALLVDCDDVDLADHARVAATTRLLTRVGGALLFTGRERWHVAHRPVVALDVPRPSTTEQRALWLQAVGPQPGELREQVDRLVTQFSLGAATIQAAATDACHAGGDGAALGERLWDACRRQARPRMDDLAQRIEPVADWDDLVLPGAQRAILRTIELHVRNRARVYEDWGFQSRGGRGLGITALFAGASGTGKTLAAEMLARALRLDLYRVDLSQVVSKYIGETEKNLSRLFDAAEDGGAVLLFDEADALFGKRSEVKDSHDRYANIEVSYLLQRMEAYRGLAILTTNLKSALDPAFLRRIRFVVQFPYPDAAQRAAIWSRMFPACTPTAGLDDARLAQLDLAGGNIHNIALGAAFLAADRDEPVGMAHILAAARTEYVKIEKPLTDAEIRGW
jgi:hypothetical protein